MQDRRPQGPLRDFTRTPLRSRFEAWALAKGADLDHDTVGLEKQRLIGGLSGTVVELGPGPGTNMRYHAPGVRVIAIEPNSAMHPRLRAQGAAHGVDLEVRTLHGERLDVADGAADAVVGTLVLCGVDDPRAVLAEVRRVLRPGGTYVVYEHVQAAAGTLTRLAQRVAKRPQRWLLNGCEVDRDTGALLTAAGFAATDLRPFDAGAANAWTRSRIIGTCTR